MSEDEIFALLVSVCLGVFGWYNWIRPLLRESSIHTGAAVKVLAFAAPALAFLSMLFVLKHWASHDVRYDSTYIAFYLGMWFGWTGILVRVLAYLGLSCHDDMFEARNLAAAIAISGSLIGITFAFAGGNIGDGPGWWVVVFSSGLATASLLGLWFIWNKITPVADAITIDRDVASAWRTLGFFIGGGLITGRAAAGNWVSAAQTTRDFVLHGWTILPLLLMAVALDFQLRPTPPTSLQEMGDGATYSRPLNPALSNAMRREGNTLAALSSLAPRCKSNA